jgi:hypothetical protein
MPGRIPAGALAGVAVFVSAKEAAIKPDIRAIPLKVLSSDTSIPDPGGP